MKQIRKLLQGLSLQQRVSLIAAAMLVAGGIYAFSHWSYERDFKPVYSDLSPEDAAAVLAKLKESGTEYRLGEASGTILIPSARIPEMRLQMASAGVPKSGRNRLRAI